MASSFSSSPGLPADIHGYTRESWNSMAHEWVKLHGENGNDFHTQLVSPTAEKLLQVRPGKDDILEIACGPGIFAQRLHQLGANFVVATDFSAEFVAATRVRCEGLINMEFLVLDATDEKAIVEKFGLERFHKAVCNMGLMDMDDIDPLFSAMHKILKPGGSFVFTITHPCFNGNAPCKGIEEIEDPFTHDIRDVFYIKVSEYLQWKPCWGFGFPGQTVKQLYFNRPLHEIFGIICKNGFSVDGFEEPSFSGDDKGRKRQLRWSNFVQIPPIVGIRCRKLGSLK